MTFLQVKGPNFRNKKWFMNYTQKCTKTRRKTVSTRSAIASKPTRIFCSKIHMTSKPINNLCSNFTFIYYEPAEKWPIKKCHGRAVLSSKMRPHYRQSRARTWWAAGFTTLYMQVVMLREFMLGTAALEGTHCSKRTVFSLVIGFWGGGRALRSAPGWKINLLACFWFLADRA